MRLAPFNQTASRAGQTEAGQYLVPLLTRAQRGKYYAGIACWFLGLFYFWAWWLEPAHNIGTGRYLYATFGMAWLSFLPLYFLLMFIRAREPAYDHTIPAGSRVAMVVTKAPSEPFSIVKRTLLAMLAQDVTHDTWLADENPQLETLKWCNENGVKVSTRRGRADYHCDCWPRRTRCKEGNLAFFYDHYGYANYDFVAQLDADHVPTPNYLGHVLRPFADPKIGYVSAPSICDNNARASWSARSRLFSEAMFHGTLQAGYSGGWAPMCIGSHYAVRTAALREIGGLGPELAEDHSTSLMMNAHGWRGVHAINAIAHGDGPQTFADLVTQEFQWSRSLVTILLQYTPRYLGMLPARLKFQFVFSQLWYPLFSTFMAAMYLMPIIALLTGENFVGVTFADFLLHILPMHLALTVMAIHLRRDGLFRPFNARVFSWERPLFVVAQWPWAFAGTLMAIHDTVRGRFVDFRITPKGQGDTPMLPYRVLLPYLALALGSAIPVMLISDPGDARGFYVFAAINASFYALLTLVAIVRHLRENRVDLRLNFTGVLGQSGAALVSVFLVAAAFNMRGPEGLEALSYGLGPLSITEAKYSVSGAGMDRAGLRRVRLRFAWKSSEGRAVSLDAAEGE